MIIERTFAFKQQGKKHNHISINWPLLLLSVLEVHTHIIPTDTNLLLKMTTLTLLIAIAHRG